MPAATVITHGCRANLAEKDALARLAPAGATVINSCAVTNEAVRDARAAVRAASAQGPVYITGCAATTLPERFSDLATIIPNDIKFLPETWGRSGEAPAISTRQSRGFVAVQDGCDHDCTFCITRLARGKSRSVPMADVVARVRDLVARGVNEVVLTGIDTTSYGADLPDRPMLGELVQAILGQVPALPRLRLSSLDAAEADPALLEALGEVRLMPFVHLSLQSGDDLILKRMKRRHSRADAVALVERMLLRRPDLAVSADLIAGFPTESEAAHLNSLALIADCQLAQAHVFPFSPRPGTAAAKMPPVPVPVAKARAAQLREAAEARKTNFQKRMLHKPLAVVSEGKAGITPHGFKLIFQAPQPKGAVVEVTPTRIENGVLSQ